MTEMKNHFRARTAETELMVSTKVSGRVVDNLHPAHAIPNNSAIPKLPCWLHASLCKDNFSNLA